VSMVRDKDKPDLSSSLSMSSIKSRRRQRLLPGPFSRKMTFDSGDMLEPVITISPPPLTKQLRGLQLCIWGRSVAERWAASQLHLTITYTEQ
jgi:hypothetical protein